jgi:hypothetical protein
MNKILKITSGIIFTVCIFFLIFVFMWIKYPKIFMFQPDNAEITYKCFGFTNKIGVPGGRPKYFCIGIKYDKKCFDIKYEIPDLKRPTGILPIIEKKEVECR